MGYMALITIKNWNPRNEFKKWIKLWKAKVFPFSIWKTRIIQVGFIWSFIHAALMRDNYKSSLTKAVVQTCSVKKVLLESSQNLQENTCARVSFLIKKRLCNFIKKEALAQVFSCNFCEISKNNFFYRTTLTATFALTYFGIKYCIKGVLGLYDPRPPALIKVWLP